LIRSPEETRRVGAVVIQRLYNSAKGEKNGGVNRPHGAECGDFF